MKEIVIPKIIWLTVNRACNLRCCWCYAKGAEYSSADNATPEYARSVLGLAKSLSVKSVTIIGGEPTLWPHLLDTNQFCLEQDIRSTIVTNAIRFSDDSFWDRYIQSPNSSAGVSIKAHSANQLRLIAGSKQFESSIKGLKRAISHFRCGVDIVYNSFYSQNLVDIVKFAVDCGARSVSIGPCTPTFDGTWVDSRFMIEPTIMVKSITRDYEQLCSITNGHLSLFMKMPLCIWPRDFIERLIKERQITTICQLQQRSGIIFDASGNVMMCNGLLSYPIGKFGRNFVDANTFVEFLNSPTIEGHYDAIKSYPSKKCIGCPMWINCGGGCPLLWAAYKADNVIRGW